MRGDTKKEQRNFFFFFFFLTRFCCCCYVHKLKSISAGLCDLLLPSHLASDITVYYSTPVGRAGKGESLGEGWGWGYEEVEECTPHIGRDKEEFDEFLVTVQTHWGE